MSVSTATKLDLAAAALKEGAGKLADVLKQHATLKAELEASASDAEAAGLHDFGQVFRDMARKLGPLATSDAKATAVPSKPRGRPPKPTADKPSST